MKIAISLAILIIIIKVFLEIRKSMSRNRLLDIIEERKSDFNYYKVLPHDLKELQINESNDGRYNLVFTPISIKQIDEVLFLIGVKAKYRDSYIGFNLVMNGETQQINDPNSEFSEFNIFGLDTNQDNSDGLLQILAHLFNVEISNKSQIVRSVVMVTEKFDVNIQSIQETRGFTAYFTDNKSPIISPALDFFINIEKGEIIIQEIDKLYRPIIVNKLIFKPNIKS